MADQGCCSSGGCCEPRPALDRRAFLALSTLGTAGTILSARAVASQLGLDDGEIVVVPSDKGLSPERIGALTKRGKPTAYRQGALQHIGMPVGGITAGRLYLGGDGRLWLWDVNNPDVVTASGWEGGTYQKPLTPTSPFRQGFALRTTARGKTTTRSLDSDGFTDVTFTGKYPIGTVRYKSNDSLLEVALDAFSPFVPLNFAASSLPATMLTYTLRNTSDETVDLVLAGWSENPVCLDNRTQRPMRLRARDFSAGEVHGLEFSVADGVVPEEPRPDIVFEDFEGTTYERWTVEGRAFGPGPVTSESVPDYFKRFGDLHVHGTRFVTSHAFWPSGDPGNADGLTGKLTSREFTIERRYVALGVGGGHWKGETSVNLIVDGKLVGSLTGNDSEPLRTRVFDVHELEGKQARIEIVDASTGPWGHINCDYIVFTDEPDLAPIDKLQDYGTFALAAFDNRVTVHPALADGSTLDAIFDAADGPRDVDASKQQMTGAIRLTARLRPGESTTVRFVISWFFPTPRDGQFGWLADLGDGLRHHYASRFDSAGAVAAYIGRERVPLENATRSFVETWYDDSTLPYWFLERTLAPASTLATTTCYRFANGRFYAEEGEYCCDGTCQHVWNYAQSVARLFPELERDVRERVDLGIAFKDSGLMGYRGELFPDEVAHDGQAGTILRIYREHQMSPDDAFLRRTWPKVKKSIDFLVRHDGEPDGIFEAAQYNTLDQTWFGEIPWVSGLYVAALRAGAEMAKEMGDSATAATYTRLADTGSAYLDRELWNSDYGFFFQRIDPAHSDATNSNRGSFADQMYGETYARQLGLPRVFPVEKSVTALRNLYRYNFVSDHEAFRRDIAVKGGRWFATQGESGLLMCAWPFGGDEEASGGGEPFAVGYFNEVWTGQEYQVAAHMLSDGLVEEGLVLTRAVYDRYDAAKRNPYNEIECSDHYSRAMMSHAVYLAMCGYEYHGPRGHLGFAPRLSPEKFRAAFTAAEGWGSYEQHRRGHTQTASIEVRYGRLRLNTLAFETGAAPSAVRVRLGREAVEVSHTVSGSRVEVTLAEPLHVATGQIVTVTIDG